VAELLTFLHLPSDVAWTLPHMGTNLDELVANMRAGKAPVSEPKLAPPVGTPFIPPMPAEAPPAPAPEPVLETVTAQPKENPVMSDLPEAKPALKSKTIWGVFILAMAPFVGQIGDALQVAGSTAPSTGEAIAGVTATAMTFVGAILAVIGRMAAGQPLK
jgi:hypothetical protein